MRPEILFPLFRPVTALKGVGPRLGALIEQAAGPRVVDLCWHLPTGLIDRRLQPPVAALPDGALATVTVTVQEHQPPRNPRLPYKVICADDSGRLTLVFFNPRRDFLERNLPPGATRLISGQVSYYGGEPQMAHPDHILAPEDAAQLPLLEPVYGLTGGLTARPMHKAVRGAVDSAPELPEWLDPAYCKREGWPGWRQALGMLHEPEDESALLPEHPARRRLAFDELLANQLALALTRRHQRARPGRAISGDGRLVARALTALPYELTVAQRRALDEIGQDLKSEHRMLRLLQGDVGAGKTAVAFLTMLTAVEAGCQAALMAPTEILARQHFATLAPLCEAVGVRLAVLTGRDKGKARQAILERLAGGDCDIVVGTHALFQEDIQFRDLALAVVDEQHRFGVHQRLLLAGKGGSIDMLVMTATPIPRTLTLTVYGDMDISVLDEKPPGREPIDTRAMPLSRLGEVVDGLHRALAAGARVYWVCPLVEESDQLDAAAAEERFAGLARVFGDRVGLVHGRMKAADKDQAMAAFADGRLSILVATTVIEVGLDVPEATVMVVEHAERFGLAQLHQLRGRIGRGGRRGTCLLLYAEPLGEAARSRIGILRRTDDGFLIAEEDLRLRGAGDLLGTRQSGLPVFRLADPAAHQDLMLAARDDARMVLDREPELDGARGAALRVLLYLFERDAAIRYLRSG